MSESDISHLLAKARRLAHSWGEADPEEPASPTIFHPPAAPCRCLVMCTKFSAEPAQHRPPNCALVVRRTVLDPCSVQMIVDMSQRYGCAVWFIGDLDPIDVLLYAHMKEQLRSSRVMLKHRGINAEWIRLCTGYVREPAAALIQMRHGEAEFAEAILQQMPQVAKLIGSEGVALWRSGYKLEIEGASNPILYKRGFAQRLARYLWSPKDSVGGHQQVVV